MIKTLRNERWKEVKFRDHAYRSKYAISTHGRIASYSEKILEGKLLRGTKMGGYPTLKLKPNGQNITLFIHRLVANAFMPKKSRYQQYVIHLDFDKENNAMRNLRWATKEEMELHQQKSPAVLAYRAKSRKKGYKLTEAKVSKIKAMIGNKNRKVTMKGIAEQFGISEMQLYRIKNGENWGDVK